MYIPNNYKMVCDKPNIKQINKHVLSNITSMINFYFSDKFPIRIKDNQEENMKNANCNHFRTGKLFSF